MEVDTKSNKGRTWMLFLVSLVVTLILLVITPQWFWLVLPFPLTFLVQAMDAM